MKTPAEEDAFETGRIHLANVFARTKVRVPDSQAVIGVQMLEALAEEMLLEFAAMHMGCYSDHSDLGVRRFMGKPK